MHVNHRMYAWPVRRQTYGHLPSVDVWVCLDTLTVFSQRFLSHLHFEPAVLHVTILNLAGVAHMVDAALADFTQSVPSGLSDSMNFALDRTSLKGATLFPD